MRAPVTITRTLAILALLASGAAPASAGWRDGRWTAALDGWFASPANLSLDPAIEFDTRLDNGGDVLGLDAGQAYSTRIRGGWRDGSNENTYSVSWWSWDDDASLRKIGFMIPTLSDPFFGNVLAIRGVESAARIQARILDLTLSRRLAATKKANWQWGVGLRRATYDQEWDTDYLDIDPNTFFPFVEEMVTVDVDSKGIGMTAGVGGSYQWHKRWRTTARAQVALLRGDTDAHYTDAFEERDPNVGVINLFSRIDRDGEDRIFKQLELEARVVYNVWRTLDVSLGYWFLDWSDVVQVDRFFDDVQGGPAFRREGIAFDGVVLGASYWF